MDGWTDERTEKDSWWRYNYFVHPRPLCNVQLTTVFAAEREGGGRDSVLERERDIVMQGLLEFRKRKRFRERKKIKRMGEKKSYYVRVVELDKFILEKIL